MMHEANHTTGSRDDDLEALEAFHRAGLATIVRRLEEDPRGKELLLELVADPGVRAMLVMHGIIRSSPPPAAEPPREVVQIRLPHADGEWHTGPRIDDVAADRPFAFEAGGEKIIVVRAKGQLRAFRNACGHIGLPLDRGIVDHDEATIACPWHAYRFDAESGACLSAPDCRLESFPVRVVGGVVEVQV